LRSLQAERNTVFHYQPEGSQPPMFRSDRDRFDKFTERARKVLSRAQEEAQHTQKGYLGSEHILLGLVRENEGVAGRVLQALGVELARTREVIEELTGKGEQRGPGSVGLTPEGKKVIEMAVDETRHFNHHYVGTEHILLGLLRLPESMGIQALQAMGVEAKAVKTQTLQMMQATQVHETHPDGSRIVLQAQEMSQGKGPSIEYRHSKSVEAFNEDAREALQLAQNEAQRFSHNYIGTEHLLLGLVRREESVAGRVLSQLGIELQKVRSAVEFIIGRGDRVVLGEISLTPCAKKVIELSADETRRLGHDYLGTEHILLGLVREGEGIAAGVLESLGVKLERVRTTTLQILGQGEDLINVISAYVRGDKPSGPLVSGVQDADDLVPEPASAEDAGNLVTIRTRRVLARARAEAQHHQQKRGGTEHLLLSLIQEQNGIAFHVLRNLGINSERILTAAQFLITEEKLSEPGNIEGLTTDCRKAIALTVDEASQMGYMTPIGTEHLLLGLLSSEGIASGILITRGLTLDKTRAEVRRLMGYR
jgi:ATP-dependent Clp protease ATP-binding subunit ClpA